MNRPIHRKQNSLSKNYYSHQEKTGYSEYMYNNNSDSGRRFQILDFERGHYMESRYEVDKESREIPHLSQNQKNEITGEYTSIHLVYTNNMYLLSKQ